MERKKRFLKVVKKMISVNGILGAIVVAIIATFVSEKIKNLYPNCNEASNFIGKWKISGELTRVLKSGKVDTFWIYNDTSSTGIFKSNSKEELEWYDNKSPTEDSKKSLFQYHPVDEKWLELTRDQLLIFDNLDSARIVLKNRRDTLKLKKIPN